MLVVHQKILSSHIYLECHYCFHQELDAFTFETDEQRRHSQMTMIVLTTYRSFPMLRWNFPRINFQISSKFHQCWKISNASEGLSICQSSQGHKFPFEILIIRLGLGGHVLNQSIGKLWPATTGSCFLDQKSRFFLCFSNSCANLSLSNPPPPIKYVSAYVCIHNLIVCYSS